LVYTDATFGGMLNYYDSFSNLSNKSINNGNYIEQLALDNSTIVLFPSDWASKSAIEMYNIKLDKIKVVPFGANLRTTFSFHEIKNIIKCRSRDKLNLLFIGVDWVRKGGDIALEITNKLNHQGINTTLHVVGLKYKPINSKFIINHGIINKSTNEDYFIELFKMSHFLLVPSFAECYGLVFCEANSIGLPALSHNTGGISTIIRDDLNGKMFNIFSDIDLWVNYIAKLFEDRKSYENLCISSFYEYQTRLNWGVAGKTINNLLKDL
jgi:glycosyltransferase involved in cell wall biosynthesis